MRKLLILALLLPALLSADLSAQKTKIAPVSFNSGADDFAPAVTENLRKMFFTSDKSKSKQKVYFVEKTSEGWTFPDELEGDINDGRQCGSVTLTPDGQYMIFAAFRHDVGGEGRTDLYSARKIKGEWKDVQNLGPAVNSSYWDSQPSISADGNTLYFTSDRPGGQGGSDIWVAHRTREGWAKPVNAGSAINTSYDEMAPVVSHDNKTFTFASNRPGGQGGFDIYYSKVRGESFTEPSNAGTPVNSAGDDMFFYSIPNTNVAYFSSSREGGQGGLDIYTAIPNPYPSDAVVYVWGTVRDSKTQKPLGAKITITDLKTGQKVSTFNSDDETGNYYVVLQPGRNYSVTASKDGYLFYSEKFEIPQEAKGDELMKDIYLSQTDTRLLIFFDFDKSELKEESSPELDRVVEFLQDKPTVEIMLEGHTDDVGDPNYNMRLSLDRANQVKSYLVKNGIAPSRITTKGYGSTQPLINEKTEDARAKNRRVEMKIVKA